MFSNRYFHFLRFVVVVIGLLGCMSLFGQDTYVIAKDWTTKNTLLEASWLLVNSMDISQTKRFEHAGPTGDDSYCAESWKYYHEANPFIGKHPSQGKLNTIWVAGSLAHVAASVLLPEPYRTWFQSGTLVLSASAVTHNYNLGFSLKF